MIDDATDLWRKYLIGGFFLLRFVCRRAFAAASQGTNIPVTDGRKKMAKKKPKPSPKAPRGRLNLSIDLNALEKLYRRRYDVTIDGDTKGGLGVRIRDGDTKGGFRDGDTKGSFRDGDTKG